jgi:nitrogen fixation NifU-like protein
LYSERLLTHFREPRNAGALEPPAVTVEVENPACGDILRLSVLWEEGRAVRCAFQVRGCTASIAAGSALTEWLTGRSREALAALSAGEIAAAVEAELDGLPAASKHAAVLCADGVRAALAEAR